MNKQKVIHIIRLSGAALSSVCARAWATLWSLRSGLTLTLLFLAVGGFYYWTAASANYTSIREVRGIVFSRNSAEYYPLLTDGFLHGQLSLYKDPDPQLLKMQDPWDPAKTGVYRLPDVTFFRGRFYLYFGPAPVLLFFLPVKLLTGFYPSHSFAAFFFCLAGFGINLLLFDSIRRRNFPTLGLGWLIVGTLILGYATAVPQMLRRPDIWEVAIACGYFTLSVAIAGIYLCLVRSRAIYLLISSAAFGLAAASRPTLLFSSLAILIPLTYLILGRRGDGRRYGTLQLLLAAALPSLCCIGGLLWYNYARFESPFEFGQRYQMHARDERKAASMGLRYIGFNAHVYFWAHPRLTVRFPFVRGINVPRRPPGQLGFENVYGLLPTMPALLAAGASLLLLSRVRLRRLDSVSLFVASIIVVFGTTCGLVLLFAGACNRYQVDFAPSLALLAAIGVLLLVKRLRRSESYYGPVRVLTILLTIWTVSMSTLVSIEHNEILKTGDEQTWRAISRVGNIGAFLLDKISGAIHAPLKLTLRFPDKASGSEALFVGGDKDSPDTLSINYLARGEISFSVDHKGFGGPTSAPIAIDPESDHELILELGSLYPQYDLQYYRSDEQRTAESLRRRLYIALDGKTVFDRSAAFDTPNVNEIYWGWTVGTDAKRTFSGEVLASSWLHDFNPLPSSRKPLPLDLEIKFPEHRIGSREPIVATGEIGHADIFYVEYLGENSVRFGLDHWSLGARKWPPMRLNLSKSHRIRITMGRFLGGPSSSSLRVDLDGVTIINTILPLYKVTQDAIYVGYAPYLNSSTGLEFHGEIEDLAP